jgi:signal transduction histidine kinase
MKASRRRNPDRLPPSKREEVAGRVEDAEQGEAMLDLVQQMHSSVALPEVLGALCRRMVEALGMSAAAVFEVRRGAEPFVQIASYGLAPDVAERFVRFRYTPAPPQADRLAAGLPVAVYRTAAPPDEVAWLDGLTVAAAALFPLRATGALHGLLAVGSRNAGEMTEGQWQSLKTMARQATTAMVLAGFLRNAEGAAGFRAAVSGLAVELNAATDRATALQLLCSRGRAIFHAAWGALLLGGGDRLIEVAADGDLAGAADTLSVPLSDERATVVRAYRSGEVLFERGASSQSLLAVPLVGSERPVGVLCFRDLHEGHRLGAAVAGEARILGALAAAVLRNLDLMTRLHKANADLRRANTLKDQLLASASHDLRTPLNVIIGYGQLVLEGSFGDCPPELRQVIERMVASACDQLSLVEDLLDLSRIELNILSVKTQDIPLAPLFAEMEFLAAGLVQQRPVRALVHAVAPDLWVHADPDRLRQILTNLLTNAAKYTDEGCIELLAVRDGVRVRLGVRDSGIGIAPEHHKLIFEPFARVSEERASSGAGLGLAIAQRLAHLMRGAIGVESEIGKGSTFWVTVPVGHPVSAGTELASRPTA